MKFERIHPFQDGNGRVGRLIMFKECLKYNIVPFIIEDNLKMFYYRGLKEWNNEKGYLTDACLTAQICGRCYGKRRRFLMFKLDGFTIKHWYENGELTEASTRGGGDAGELIIHSIPAFYNMLLKITHKGRLVITGEV